MSTLKFNQWLNSDGTENYKCRAWVNFNGTGTVSVRASGNVSSITDNGAGDYTVNFSNALPDANYSHALDLQTAAIPSGFNNQVIGYPSGRTASSLRVATGYNAGGSSYAAIDFADVLVTIFR